MRTSKQDLGKTRKWSIHHYYESSVQFSSVAQSCPTLCDPMNHSMPGLPVHHQLLEPTQTHVHRVGDATQSSPPLLSPSPPAPNISQHQGLFKWVGSLHQVAKVPEFQLQHQSFQWTPRTDLLLFYFKCEDINVIKVLIHIRKGLPYFFWGNKNLTSQD